MIYEKGVAVLDKTPHIAPNTLETWSEVAVSTRIKPSAKLTDQYKFVQENKPALLGDLLKLGDDEAKRRIKIKLYSGETVPGFKTADVKSIQEEGITQEEGMSGLSPVAARSLLIEMMGLAEDCISPRKLFSGIEQRLQQGGKPGYLDKAEWQKYTGLVKKRWEEDLQQTVLGAFRNDMDSKIETVSANFGSDFEVSAPVFTEKENKEKKGYKKYIKKADREKLANSESKSNEVVENFNGEKRDELSESDEIKKEVDKKDLFNS
jgi:predicted Ser/Thr protein kinase